MWGQVTKYITKGNDKRIIPTRVGTRKIAKFYDVSIEDHPHACGDKVEISTIFFTVIGSSPRVWGQVYLLIPIITV